MLFGQSLNGNAFPEPMGAACQRAVAASGLGIMITRPPTARPGPLPPTEGALEIPASSSQGALNGSRLGRGGNRPVTSSHYLEIIFGAWYGAFSSRSLLTEIGVGRSGLPWSSGVTSSVTTIWPLENAPTGSSGARLGGNLGPGSACGVSSTSSCCSKYRLNEATICRCLLT